MEKTSRALTEDEIRDRFLKQVHSMARYWAGLDGSNVSEDSTPLYRTEGLAFSILAAIDGCSMAVPAFKLIADPHPEDQSFHEENDENYYPEGVDISGGLHEFWSSVTKI